MENPRLVPTEVFSELKKDISNTFCFDCKSSDSNWTSLNNGIFLCLNCASIHRGLGIETSFIKSISLDEWTEKQLKLMMSGGNQSLTNFFDFYSLLDKEIKYKYKTNAAKFYREKIEALSNDQIFEKPKPSIEEGLLVTEDDKKNESERHEEKKTNEILKEYLEKAYIHSKEFTRKFADKIKEIKMKDIEDKTKVIFSDIGEKYENFNLKENIETVKAKTGEIIDSTKTKWNNFSVKETYESSKVTVVEKYEVSKVKIIENFDHSKVVIINKFNELVQLISKLRILERAKELLKINRPPQDVELVPVVVSQQLPNEENNQ